MRARYWHGMDHAMPARPEGKDPRTGVTCHGDVLTGRKSVGEALYEAETRARQQRAAEANLAEILGKK